MGITLLSNHRWLLHCFLQSHANLKEQLYSFASALEEKEPLEKPSKEQETMIQLIMKKYETRIKHLERKLAVYEGRYMHQAPSTEFEYKYGKDQQNNRKHIINS